MSGYNVLWVPGMDHAGIATQVAVEKKLMRENKVTRHDIGRQRFISQLWDWKNEHGGTILNQERRSKAVTEAFVRLYKEGLIYRDQRIVNWDCTLQTAISDAEILAERHIERSLIMTMKFNLIFLSLSPIRLREIWITPAHDPNEFLVGKHHHLEFINIFTDDGKINSNGGAEFEGMPQFTARMAVTEALRAKGLYRGAQKNEMKLGICSRSNDVVEQMLKSQWFVDCENIAKLALGAVVSDNNKKIEIIQHQYEQELIRWLENICDWCISRQLWWGHRVPAWYVTLENDQFKDLGSYNDHWVVGRSEQEVVLEAKQMFAGKKFEIAQDPDVLDTWFSAGLLPLSVLGWPEVTPDFKAFYPTSLLQTGHDVLYLWVARMIMLGMKLGGDVPFRKVYLHPMIYDSHGQKMSKSKGNVIDPLDLINGISLEGLHKKLDTSNLDQSDLEKAKMDQNQLNKITLDVTRIVNYRQWCNELWYIVNFAMKSLGDDYSPHKFRSVESMPLICQWLLSILNKAVRENAIKPYFENLSELEYVREASRDTIWIYLDIGLRLLHPLMPFITEELWQNLPRAKGIKKSIMISEYPSVVEAWTNERIEEDL
ncbi:hypothetical protein OPV22_003814 [Ensete ventricosum]|uniref:valine--tRNA ligase n=1 Tax=Ensete ventricosum TaxID=4639 RepID=A0AAV8S1Z6_ENSVE|nr:hypothetical protein OPV22_003814 [Ensete ventricosum]